jgi:thymidine kinase
MIVDIHNYPDGFLELFVGPMFSGKTEMLINMYRKYMICNINVMVINHSSDNRKYSIDRLSSHNNDSINCYYVNSLDCIIKDTVMCEKYYSSQIIMINEGQFFDDIYNNVMFMLNDGKIIYVSGLDCDYKQKQFENIIKLIPICDNYKKLTSICSRCKNGTIGIFSHRICKDNTSRILIGDTDSYMTLCRKCYVYLNN